MEAIFHESHPESVHLPLVGDHIFQRSLIPESEWVELEQNCKVSASFV
jgi:hypothetical protein